MKKCMCICLLALLLVLGCVGCEGNKPEYDRMNVFVKPLEQMTYESEKVIIYLDDEKSALAQRCFEHIQVGGASLALPIRVADLADAFVVEEMETGSEYIAGNYPGYRDTEVYITCKGREFGRGKILYPEGSNYTKGVLVNVTLSNGALKIILGEGVLSLSDSWRTLNEIFGGVNKELSKNQWPSYCYVLKNGNVISFSDGAFDHEEEALGEVSLSTWYIGE